MRRFFNTSEVYESPCAYRYNIIRTGSVNSCKTIRFPLPTRCYSFSKGDWFTFNVAEPVEKRNIYNDYLLLSNSSRLLRCLHIIMSQNHPSRFPSDVTLVRPTIESRVLKFLKESKTIIGSLTTLLTEKVLTKISFYSIISITLSRYRTGMITVFYSGRFGKTFVKLTRQGFCSPSSLLFKLIPYLRQLVVIPKISMLYFIY